MKKFLQYNSDDFAQEQSFIRWVRKTNDDDISFWDNWSNNHPNKKEEIDKAISIVNQLVFKEESIPSDAKSKIWSGIETKISPVTGPEMNVATDASIKSNRGIIKLISLGAIAAALTFVFIMLNGKNDFDTSINTHFAEKQTISLPDGSTAQLNSDSKLSYDKKSWAQDRRLLLEGEAFFKVEKGSSFKVVTKNGEVSVLGTSFNVYARDNLLDVYCKTGKVAVNSSNKETILSPNQSVSVLRQEHIFENEVKEKDSRLSWQRGIYSYKATSIEEVAREIERQLDVEINIPQNIKQLEFTGSFSSGDLESALSEVFWPLNLKFSREGKKVNIRE